MTDNFDVAHTNGMLLFEQALKFHQTKILNIESYANLLSEGMPFFLEVVSNNQTLINSLEKKYKCSDQLIRTVVIEYLIAAYFRHIDNPYRVLGLSPWSNLEDAKSRYRFLMRLFHPDRGLVNDRDDLDIAANINHAYSKISDKFGKDSARSYYASGDDTYQNSQNINHNVFNIADVSLQLISVIQKKAKYFYGVYFSGTLHKLAHALMSHIVHVLKTILKSTKFTAKSVFSACKFFLDELKLIVFGLFHFLFKTKLLLSQIKNIQITPMYSKLAVLSSVLVVFYALDGIEASDKLITQTKYYLEEQAEAAKQLALKQELARKEAERVALEKAEAAKRTAMREEELRKEAARKEEQARIMEARRAAEQAEAAKQLALKQELARKEAERVALEKAEAAKRIAMREEELRKEAAHKEEQARIMEARRAAEQVEAAKQLALKQELARKEKYGRQSKELDMIFTRVLIDENQGNSQNEKSPFDIKID
jgi:hypothetical protein